MDMKGVVAKTEYTGRGRGKVFGFTMLETLIAALILSLTVVTIAALFSRSLAAVSELEGYERAWSLVDRQFTLISQMGIEEFIKSGELTGFFESDDGQGGYWFSADITPTETDGLYRVDLTVYWGDERQPRQVVCSSIFSGAAELLEGEGEEL